MNFRKRRLLCAVLSATTVMSTLTSITAVATNSDDNINTADVPPNSLIQSETLAYTMPATMPQVLDEADSTDTENFHATGDLTFEQGISDDVPVINSVSEYYKLTGKKYKVPSGGSLNADLPSSVDNSQSKYFPAIGNQNSLGSCIAWAQGYYQFTYTMNKAMGVETTPQNTFSPKFIYNNVNGGKDSGISAEAAYDFMKYQGNVPISMVPYDDDYLSWSPTEDVWKTSIKYRVKDYQIFDTIGNEDTQITAADDSDLEPIKTALNNGDVLAFSTFANYFDRVKLTKNANAPENDKYAGEYVVSRLKDTKGGHRMTLVGYNDNIWTDINKNGTVDNGEMGAFKIANSWGASYGNKGFIWVAYDALNEDSVVDGAPETPNRSKIMTTISRIDVMPYNTGGDLYFKYTWNSANRNQTKAVVTAELNGTTYSANVYTPFIVGLSRGEYSYDGTTNSNDGTMVLALDNVFPEITSQNLTDCNWSVTFTDTKAGGAKLTVKDAQIVDASTNRVFKPQNAFPFTLDGNEKTIELAQTQSTDTVIYYRGYDKPNLHYKVNNGAWTSDNGVPMTYNIEKRGYLYKYVIKLQQESDVTLYFTDNNGNIDNNNGKNYKAGKGLNYFATENVAKPITATVKCIDSPISTNKMLNFEAYATGGYEPYQYQYIFTNLDTGVQTTKKYLDINYTTNTFTTQGNYRITVNVKDYSDKVVSTYIEMYLENKPFEYTEFKVTPNEKIMVGDEIEFFALTNFENIDYAGYAKNLHNITIKDSNGTVAYSTDIRSTKFSLGGKTSDLTLTWMPRKAGNYSAKISSTDSKGNYAESTINFNVTEFNGTIIGDIDNSGAINLTDALLVMKYNVGGIDASKIWLRLADGNDDGKVDLRDAIYIMKYIVSDKNAANVGKVNYKELPTEPPTEKPTEAPTNPVTKNLVTFTNSQNWSGTMYCYYWSDSNKSMTTWPGKPMTKSGTNDKNQALYTFEVPSGATYIIFTNNSKQTVDISYKGGNIKYCPTTTDSMGHYKVEILQ
ncbi:MAG: starch-binding protein [Acutalibacteraceae bacterium]|nr:starch-binding protein [Acutalibacteraceae bacterium]